ncbi:MAG: sulfite exporter TauE/SafE family protein [Deltaproteobacteria bacterium]|nr:sulfite exporter TauE/SafE family protein [Deltaproteobacteria bacterium]
MQYLLLILAAIAGGAINSVAGGGTLVTFPTLLSVGVGPVAANATSTVALVPGSLSAFWGYRSELQGPKHQLLWLGVPSAIGGLLGAIFLLKAGDSLFSRLVPWLILSATGLFIVQDPVRRWTEKRLGSGDGASSSTARLIGVAFFQFLIALYGGFFGAGIGILMLAALGMLGSQSIHRMNGLKNFAAVCINSVAAATFILQNRVRWDLALMMAAGAIVGGYGGAGIAKKIGQKNVRRVVVVVGLSIGAYMLVKRYA